MNTSPPTNPVTLNEFSCIVSKCLVMLSTQSLFLDTKWTACFKLHCLVRSIMQSIPGSLSLSSTNVGIWTDFPWLLLVVLAVGLWEKGIKPGGIRGRAFILFVWGQTPAHAISKTVSLFSSAAHYTADIWELWHQQGPQGSSRSKLPDGATLAHQCEEASPSPPFFCATAFGFRDMKRARKLTISSSGRRALLAVVHCQIMVKRSPVFIVIVARQQ